MINKMKQSLPTPIQISVSKQRQLRQPLRHQPLLSSPLLGSKWVGRTRLTKAPWQTRLTQALLNTDANCRPTEATESVEQPRIQHNQASPKK